MLSISNANVLAVNQPNDLQLKFRWRRTRKHSHWEFFFVPKSVYICPLFTQWTFKGYWWVFFFLDFEPFSLCDSYLPEREGKRPALGLVFFSDQGPSVTLSGRRMCVCGGRAELVFMINAREDNVALCPADVLKQQRCRRRPAVTKYTKWDCLMFFFCFFFADDNEWWRAAESHTRCIFTRLHP